jgi:hypothetical protein
MRTIWMAPAKVEVCCAESVIWLGCWRRPAHAGAA